MKTGSEKWSKLAGEITFQTRPFINGDYASIANATSFTTINPSTLEQLAVYQDIDPATVDRAVQAARKAFHQKWQRLVPDKRKSLLFDLASAIKKERSQLALLDSLEMGMPISMALDNVDGSIDILLFYAELIDKVYGEVAATDTTMTLGINAREPRGVIGIISPWNFPFATALYAIAPALAAGNTVVIKPSEQSPSSILKLAELASSVGIPDGVVNVLTGLGRTTGAELAKHGDIDMLHFTGSINVGRQLMVYSGQTNGKPVNLELGGKSPQIVFEDAADIENIGAMLAQDAFYNSGQLCLAKTRLLVHEKVKHRVLEQLLKDARQSFCAGDPLDPQTSFGPIASQKQFDKVNHYLEIGANEGANLLQIPISGSSPERGYHIQPVIFDNAHAEMRIFKEEIFGPVLTMSTFRSEEEAVLLANHVDYGLAANVWTKNIGVARRMANALKAGEVKILSTANPCTHSLALTAEPYGASGHGVLGGRRGLDPFTRFKSVQFISE